jgi:hypothetical protein
MPLVQTQGGLPYHVEDFAEGCERSVKGALHFLPSSTKKITADELKHIQDKHKAFARGLRIVTMDETQSRGAKKLAAEAKAQPKHERASHRPTKAQRKAAGVKEKAAKAKAPGEVTKPSIEPMVAAAEERKLAAEPAPVEAPKEDDDKGKGKKKGWNK